MNTKVIKCPNCDGKGHIFDSTTLLVPVFLVFGLFETSDKDGITRKECPDCKGEGYKLIK